MATTKSELLQGTLDLLILKTLATGAMHGYAVAQRIQQRSDDVLVVEEGSRAQAANNCRRKRRFGNASAAPSRWCWKRPEIQFTRA
jgi:PadR family transcriptional regulator, regulatory protein PadR